MTTPLIKAIARKMCTSEDDVPSHWDDYSSLAQAALTAIKEAGYAVVPREPTEAMISAGNAVEMVDVPDCDPPVELANTRAIYRAMISAAQGDGA